MEVVVYVAGLLKPEVSAFGERAELGGREGGREGGSEGGSEGGGERGRR